MLKKILNYYFDVDIHVVTRIWHQNFAYLAFPYEIRYESWGKNYFQKMCFSTQD